MSVVYLVQERPGRNFADAFNYGEVKALLPANENIMLSTEPCLDRLRRGLHDFGDEDYLLPMGDPVAMGIATCIAANENGGRVKMLKWDRIANRYLVLQIDLYKKGDRFDERHPY